ncbi:hypothetical protein TUM19329_01620 [Legionella antarctica]|uniref:Uncharacterized protein n=1 Tax=Legionella antarctica TaxID=2708020 RepID=A0A6F8T012_9GAMM|nr:hypothetical protein [Legionella antarctica]BCA93801.1 hypothetical protein TUM19329_01620 [Legionella antarctica]
MSIIIQYQSEEQALDGSATGQLLSEEMLNILKESVKDKEKMKAKAQMLTKVLKVDGLPPEVINILIRPWYRANMLASWWEYVSWSDEKDRAQDYLDLIAKFEKMLNRDQGNIIKLMLFMTSSELDISKLFLTLEELKEFFSIFLNLEFQNGKPCSAMYFIRYAINSLFYMAKQMGLKDTGKPTQLNQYMEIVTQRSYIERNKDRSLFNKLNFQNEYDKNKNIPLWYIYNPHCKTTNNLLTQIRTHYK